MLIYLVIRHARQMSGMSGMIEMWIWLVIVSIIATVLLYIFCSRNRFFRKFFGSEDNNTSTIYEQLAMLEERTKYLEGLEEKIEKVREKQDSDSRELRESLYNEYSERLQSAVNLLKEIFDKLNKSVCENKGFFAFFIVHHSILDKYG